MNSLVIVAPGLEASFLAGSRVRVDAGRDGSTLSVFEGRVRLTAPSVEMELREGQAARMTSRFQLLTEAPAGELDGWSEQCDRESAARVPDLDAGGEWLEVTGLGRVWRPAANEGFVPNRAGRWRWSDDLGFTWIASEPWGWLPYHSGRWVRTASYGWVWSPGADGPFHPGDVVWVLGPGLAGWAPPGGDPGDATYAQYVYEAREVDPARAPRTRASGQPVAALPPPLFPPAPRRRTRTGTTRVVPASAEHAFDARLPEAPPLISEPVVVGVPDAGAGDPGRDGPRAGLRAGPKRRGEGAPRSGAGEGTAHSPGTGCGQDRPPRRPRPPRRLPPISGPSACATPNPATPGRGGDNEEVQKLFGIHAVEEALRARRPVERVLIARGAANPRLQKIIDACRAASIPLRFEPREALDREAGKGAVHQGVVAVASSHRYRSIAEVVPARGEPSLLVVLDGVEDPHNLGAIIRTAHAAGANAVVVPERRAAGLTEAAAKAAAGALEYLPVVRVPNLNRALEFLKEEEYWIFGLDERGDRSYDAADYRGRAALVLGGEGRGLHQQTARHCDFLIRIPTAGRIASLNVSVAAGVVLFEAMRQRSKTT